MKVFDAAQVFKVIVEQGSMIKAAKHLKLSPSLVSKRLYFLENQLGIQLLRRTTRHIELTEAGEIFFERIADIIENWDASLEEINSLTGNPKGTIRISSPQPLSSRLFIPIFRGFQESYPGIRLELINTKYEHLPLMAADITICRKLDELNSFSYIALPLFTYTNALYASPAYLANNFEPKTIADLANHQCLCYGTGKTEYTWKFRNSKEVTIRPYLTSDSTENIISSAVNGLGVAYIPRKLINQELEHKQLINILPNSRSRNFETYLYYQKLKFTPQKIRLFIDYLKKYFDTTAQ